MKRLSLGHYGLFDLHVQNTSHRSQLQVTTLLMNEISSFSKIQLVVYYQCCILIG